MKTILQLTVLVATLAAASCSRDEAPATAGDSTQPGLQAWTLPAAPGAAQPDLVTAPDGRLLLSWLDTQPGRRTRLQYAEFSPAGHWQGPKTIAIGASFVVNWADTPHILATPDGALWVQWLQKSAEAGASYDVLLSTSRNDGMNWSEPLRPHADGTVSEHGFVSMWPQGNDRLGIAWLDGRNMVAAAGHAQTGHDGHGAGAMTLRSAVFDGSLRTDGEVELDASVCDCCQTDAALTAKGPLLVYRDRTEDEIRDIHVARFDGKAWSPSKPVFADQWKMPACPVNGPSVAARGDEVVVAWYTGAGDQPTVKLARSTDAGDSFSAPLVLEQDDTVQGRVDVALDAGNAWVLWLREGDAGQSLWLARYAPDLSKQIEKVEVARLQGRGRGTGFPQLALREGKAYLVWTDVAGGTASLHGAVYTPKVL
ncbi:MULTISPECIES: sialidase family protein [unclassified Lysobacter]|uniref:sialidase family protein n=1 Tax=unclassified Lysobacter TaxID=2635362 RepID=UPI001F569F3F|nr:MULTISPECIES: sialidase family protein [unclassified Lysobacter]